MKNINQSYKILKMRNGDEILKHLEYCGRICYASHDMTKDGSAEKLLRSLIKWGHESVLEHESITVEFTIDRSITHQLVRHRLASYSEQSTRYCNFSNDKFGKEIQVIHSESILHNPKALEVTERILKESEKAYLELLSLGIPAEDARDVLPTNLASKIAVTANLREWRTILKLRTHKSAHPKIRKIMLELLKEFKQRLPIVFDDIEG